MLSFYKFNRMSALLVELKTFFIIKVKYYQTFHTPRLPSVRQTRYLFKKFNRMSALLVELKAFFIIKVKYYQTFHSPRLPSVRQTCYLFKNKIAWVPSSLNWRHFFIIKVKFRNVSAIYWQVINNLIIATDVLYLGSLN